MKGYFPKRLFSNKRLFSKGLFSKGLPKSCCSKSSGKSLTAFCRETFYLIYNNKSSSIRIYSGPYFPSFGLNMARYFVSFRIPSECGKIRTRRSPNTDTFYAVLHFLLFSIKVKLNIFSLQVHLIFRTDLFETPIKSTLTFP